MISWDNVDEASAVNKPDRAFFTLPYDDDSAESEKLVHQWLQAELGNLIHINTPRLEKIKKNLALLKGLQYRDQDRRGGNEESENTKQKRKSVQKVVFNILKEAQEARNSKLVKYKPNVSVLPTNDNEMSDKVAAEMMTNLKDHIWYTERFEGVIVPEWVQKKSGQGESYLFVDWDPNKGDIHELYKAELAKGTVEGKVSLKNENGKPEKDDQGRPIMIERPIRNGDVIYEIDGPLNTFFERTSSKKQKDAKYVFRGKVMGVEEARLKYPDAADKIQGSTDAKFYDAETCEIYEDKNKCLIWSFYYRRDFTLEKGRWIVFTDKGILSNKEFPFSHTWLPCVTLTDRNNDEEQHGVSFIDDAKGPSGAFNNLSNMILQNEILVGRPKWMMPVNAADLKDLSNSTTVVQYKGPKAPVLVQANPTGQGAFTLRQTMREETMTSAAVSRSGNGNPPPGITAAVALQYLAELESDRWNQDVLQYNEAILQTVIMTFAVCGDYYDPSDKRMMRIQGRDGEWMSTFFNHAVLSKDYDVRVQGASALPESKAARMESLIYLKKEFPEQIDPEQVLEMFDFAQSKKFIQEGTVSTRAAQSENEELMNGKEIPDPEKYEDHIIHWKLHMKQMRTWAFKNKTNKDIQNRLKAHVLGTEMLMYERMEKDPQYATFVSQACVGFPIFFKPTPVLPPPEMPLPDPMSTAGAGAGVPPVDPTIPMNLPPEESVQAPGDPTIPQGVLPLEMQNGVQPPIEPVSTL